jgi:hypothetical protein
VRHLKKYGKFTESISSDMVADIKDILIELKDMGLSVDTTNFNPASTNKLYILIQTMGPDDVISINEISDDLLRLDEYSSINNLSAYIINDPDYFNSGSEDYSTIDKFINEYSGKNVTILQIIICEK